MVQGQGGGIGKQGAGHCVLHRLWAQGEVDCRHLRSLIYQDRMKPVQTAEGSQEDTGEVNQDCVEVICAATFFYVRRQAWLVCSVIFSNLWYL